MTMSTDSVDVLIVIEAFHEGASSTVASALAWLDEAFSRVPGCTTTSRMLSASTPDFLGS